MKITLFGKANLIEAQIDEFLNAVSQAGMLFEQLAKYYISNGCDDAFITKANRMREMEEDANKLASTIGRSLYSEMLIPDSRADVLSLIQDLDYLIDQTQKITADIRVELPDISDLPDDSHKAFSALIENAVACVEATVVSARAFFKDTASVQDHIHKIGFYEDEVDEIALQIKSQLFSSDLPLERKLHLRYFVDILDDLADEAEDVGEWLSIYTIKRSL